MKIKTLINMLKNFDSEAEVKVENRQLVTELKIQAIGCSPHTTRWVLLEEKHA